MMPAQSTEPLDPVSASAPAAVEPTDPGAIFRYLFEHLDDARELHLPFAHVGLPQFPPVNIFGMEIDLSITKHVVFLWIAGLLVLMLGVAAARKNTRHRVPKGIGNLVEVFVKFIRDEIVIPNMGKDGVRYLPFLLTTFFFILFMNLLGLVPFGATATGDLSVTAGLALIALITIQVAAIRKQGVGHYLAHLTGGVHWVLWPIMIPIEILGIFTKGFALCIRLFANMTGGHIVLLSIIGLIFLFQSPLIAPLPVLFAIAINLLEIFVAFLQAYVFTMLTSVFMGLGMAGGHEEEHEPSVEHAVHS